MIAPEVAALTTRYRGVQARNAAVLSALTALTFRQMVDVDDIDATSARWIDAILPRLVRQRRLSAAAAADFYRRIRELDGLAVDDLEVPDLDALSREATAAARRSLEVVGPANLKAKIARANNERARRAPARDDDGELLEPGGLETRLDEAAYQAMLRNLRDEVSTEVRAPAQRHVLDGGRDTVEEMRQRDPDAIGYYRATALGCCHFCALLASRGAVYDDDSFEGSDAVFNGPGAAKVHDGCACQMVPVFRRADFFSPRTRELRDLYDSVKDQRSPRTGRRDPLNAFRRNYTPASA